jgi:hypothetical protein
VEDNNLFENCGFEKGTIAGWFPFGGGVLVVDDSLAHSGDYCGCSTSRTQSFMGPAQSILGEVSSGDTIELSVWVYHTEDDAISFNATLLRDIDGESEWSWIGSVVAASSVWTQLSGALVLGDIDSATRLEVYVEGPAEGVSFCADDARLYRIAVAGPGSTGGAAGAPGHSVAGASAIGGAGGGATEGGAAALADI